MTLCYNCREQGHKTFECPRTVSCRSCGQVGHKERQCRMKKSNSGADSVTTTNSIQDRWGAVADVDNSSPSSLGKKAVKLQLNAPGKELSPRGFKAPPPPPPPGLSSPGLSSSTQQQWMFESTASAPDRLSPLSSKSTSQNLGPPVTDAPSTPQLDDSSLLQGLLSAYLSVASTPTQQAPTSSIYNLRQQTSNELTSDSSDYQTPHHSEKSILSLKSSRYARSETAIAETMPDLRSDSAVFQQMRWRSSSAIPDTSSSLAGTADKVSTLDSESYTYGLETIHRKGRPHGATEGTRRPASFQDGSCQDGRLTPSPQVSAYRGTSKGSPIELKSPRLATINLATAGSRSTMAGTPVEASRSSFRHSTSNSRHISWNKSVHQSSPKGPNQTPNISFSSSQAEASRLVSSLPTLPSSRPDESCASQFARRAQSSLADDLDIDPSARSVSCLSGRQSSFCLELNSNRLYSQPSPVAPVPPRFDCFLPSASLMTIALGQDPYLIAYSEPVATEYNEGQSDIPNEQASKYMAPCSVIGRPMWLLNAAALFKCDVGDPWRPWPTATNEPPSYAQAKRQGQYQPGSLSTPSDQYAHYNMNHDYSPGRNQWHMDVYASQPPVVVAVQAPREEESPNLTDDLCHEMPLSGQDIESTSPAPQPASKSNTRLRLPASPSTFSVASAPTSQRYHGSLSPSPAMRPSASSATSWLTTA